jgi:hypothetical protein
MTAMLAAILAGPESQLMPSGDRLPRWIRAWFLVARAYKREGRTDEADRAARLAHSLERCARLSGIGRAVQ